MIRVDVGRLRALILLAVFGASIAGQAMAATTIGNGDMSHAVSVVAVPMMSAGGCSNCPATGHAVMSSCSVAFCWNLSMIPAQATDIEPTAQLIFDRRQSIDRLGLTLRPEPHPPRTALQN